jgi:hypothetical protein
MCATHPNRTSLRIYQELTITSGDVERHRTGNSAHALCCAPSRCCGWGTALIVQQVKEKPRSGEPSGAFLTTAGEHGARGGAYATFALGAAPAGT